VVIAKCVFSFQPTQPPPILHVSLGLFPPPRPLIYYYFLFFRISLERCVCVCEWFDLFCGSSQHTRCCRRPPSQASLSSGSSAAAAQPVAHSGATDRDRGSHQVVAPHFFFRHKAALKTNTVLKAIS